MDDNQFGEVAVFTGQEAAGQALPPAVTGQGGSVMGVEQSRAVAEVQGAIVVAKSCPRDEHAAYLDIMKSCKRKSLAECAMYAYRRGGTLVEGASIRLAEVLARCFGNMTYGFREVGRGKDYSEVEAFAHDLQTNTRATRTFRVRHWRDKRGGGEALTAERDKYEMVAGMAQRRVRSCILEIIPGDIVEAATEACKKTIATDEKPIEQRIEEMLVAFDSQGVTKEMIEAYLQRSLKSVVPQDLVRLTQMYRSLRDGVASRDELFPHVDTKTGEMKEPETPTKTEKTESTADNSKLPTYGQLKKEFFAIQDHAEALKWIEDNQVRVSSALTSRSLARFNNECSRYLAELKPAEEPEPEDNGDPGPEEGDPGPQSDPVDEAAQMAFNNAREMIAGFTSTTSVNDYVANSKDRLMSKLGEAKYDELMAFANEHIKEIKAIARKEQEEAGED